MWQSTRGYLWGICHCSCEMRVASKICCEWLLNLFKGVLHMLGILAFPYLGCLSNNSNTECSSCGTWISPCTRDTVGGKNMYFSKPISAQYSLKWHEVTQEFSFHYLSLVVQFQATFRRYTMRYLDSLAYSEDVSQISGSPNSMTYQDILARGWPPPYLNLRFWGDFPLKLLITGGYIWGSDLNTDAIGGAQHCWKNRSQGSMSYEREKGAVQMGKSVQDPFGVPVISRFTFLQPPNKIEKSINDHYHIS